MNRRGVALPLALLTMLILGALAAGVLIMARVRWQSGERMIHALQARSLAESEAERVIANWDPLRAESLAIGAIVGISGTSPGGGLDAQDSLLRLGRGLFLVRSIGRRTAADGALLARDAVARLVRLVAPLVPDSAAVLGAGAVTLSALAIVDGSDHVPAGWGAVCPAPAAAGAGVLAGVAAPVIAACSGGPCISGAPPIGADSTLTAARLTQLGPVTISELSALADHHVAGSVGAVGPQVVAGSCVLADSSNWGDPSVPTSPCGGFLPVIEAAPLTRIAGGQGQGLLIGTGALELSGDVVFSGVVVAAGPLVIRGQARITGVVVSLDSLTVNDSALVERSRCAVGRVLAGAGRPFRKVERSWFRWR